MCDTRCGGIVGLHELHATYAALGTAPNGHDGDSGYNESDLCARAHQVCRGTHRESNHEGRSSGGSGRNAAIVSVVVVVELLVLDVRFSLVVVVVFFAGQEASIQVHLRRGCIVHSVQYYGFKEVQYSAAVTAVPANK